MSESKSKAPPGLPDCKCKENDWFAIPDSLAMGCRNCGRVIVNTGPGKWKKGASIQQWLNDRFNTNTYVDPDEAELDEND